MIALICEVTPMRLRAYRFARAATCALLAASLLSGCASIAGPAALGAGKHRSIKDDPEPAAALPAQKQAAPKTALATPQRHAAPTAAKSAALPSCASGSDCMAQLKTMVDDPSRSWIRRRVSPLEYSNGTRLFAYRALRDRLSCPEMTLALNEINAAAGAFHAPVAGVNAAQAAHLLRLNSDVGQELRAEFAGRCRS
jgi:hypothetical protein